ncbi:MAG: hypothetical protein EXR70_06670 [Deltaproteobacteria bacterium]|nr:hypothetical protein [Deltaproteobacteria bacterium]
MINAAGTTPRITPCCFSLKIGCSYFPTAPTKALSCLISPAASATLLVPVQKPVRSSPGPPTA